jgi:oxygen-independent coproporphyrinogen-3 oxidase
VRGLELNADDRLRRDVIERLMCDLSVDLGAVSARHGSDPAIFSEALVALEPMRRDGLVTISGDRVTVAPAGRTVVRLACAAFDRYLAQGKARHSSAI